jgi:hypothetical protein
MLVNVANATVYFINELRYKGIVPNDEQRHDMLPIIPVPEKYDVVSTSYLFQEYQTAKTAGINAIILTEMQKEIGAKKFYANPDVADFINTVMNLDPFPDKTTEEKGQIESQGLAKKEDVVLSLYINDFVRRAMEEDPDFAKKTDIQKREILEGYASEKVEELDSANEISEDIIDDEIPPAPAAAQPPAAAIPDGLPAPAPPAAEPAPVPPKTGPAKAPAKAAAPVNPKP